MRRPTRLRIIAIALFALALVAGACGDTTDTTEGTQAPPTTAATVTTAADDTTATTAADDTTATTAAPPTTAPTEPVASPGGDRLNEIYGELEGLDADARRARLVELAQEEDEGILFYTSLNLDDSLPVIEAFEDLTDLDVDIYRASSSTVLQRALQEADANFQGADVMLLNGPEMAVLTDQGLLLPLNSPITDDIVEAAVFPTWAGVYMNVFTAAWNTNLVDDPPETWDDVFNNFPGTLAMELGDWDWFATLIKDYFIAERGMTEDEAVALFQQAAANSAAVIDGHTLMAQLLIAGEFDAVTSAYHHRVVREAGEGAPIAWEPPVQPLVIRPNGVGIHRDTKAPATALLFAEFMMTDAQPLLVEGGRTPANQTVEGGIPEGLDILGVDIVTLNEERDKWEALYEAVVAGLPVTED